MESLSHSLCRCFVDNECHQPASHSFNWWSCFCFCCRNPLNVWPLNLQNANNNTGNHWDDILDDKAVSFFPSRLSIWVGALAALWAKPPNDRLYCRRMVMLSGKGIPTIAWIESFCSRHLDNLLVFVAPINFPSSSHHRAVSTQVSIPLWLKLIYSIKRVAWNAVLSW